MPLTAALRAVAAAAMVGSLALTRAPSPTLADRGGVPPRPTFLIETHYENDFGGRTAEDVRAYPYRAVLSGATGHLFGNRPLWFCGRRWEDALRSKGAEYMGHALALFRSRPWHELAPDRTHQVVVEGHGESGADEGVQAAVSRRGDCLIAYLPAGRRQIRVDLERLGGRLLRAYWFDPRAGQATLVDSFRRLGTRVFTPPTDADWVLVIDDEARGWGPPGGGELSARKQPSREKHRAPRGLGGAAPRSLGPSVRPPLGLRDLEG